MAGKFQLRPFDPSIDAAVDAGGGERMTERTRTVRDASGRWMVAPSIYFTKGGDPVDFSEESDDLIAQMAAQYEASSGLRFPRFPNEESASSYARRRSSTGGAEQGALAKRSPGNRRLLMRD